MMEAKHFPENFQFFHLGHVKNREITNTHIKPAAVVIFQIFGEELGTCLVSFDQEPLNTSMAVEMANILASKLVSNFCDDEEIRVELSPPTYVDPQEKAFEKYCLHIQSSGWDRSKTSFYEYRGYEESFRIQLTYIPAQRGEA